MRSGVEVRSRWCLGVRLIDSAQPCCSGSRGFFDTAKELRGGRSDGETWSRHTGQSRLGRTGQARTARRDGVEEKASWQETASPSLPAAVAPGTAATGSGASALAPRRLWVSPLPGAQLKRPCRLLRPSADGPGPQCASRLLTANQGTAAATANLERAIRRFITRAFADLAS